ncbi:hypothetical protein QF042_000290 [Pedobacter sp. W3I1]|uniref:DUF4843 domain-containing protein n=1 Tax=Pedobacter sp. W3I1 TaxID=3042291 RepID=UPI0027845998|nr:DUF4843 domain-containing protein [Pedobacter sp. W3I1]MDQ0636725.1 hypothetical protein [Pedobacter sp. W3I1]
MKKIKLYTAGLLVMILANACKKNLDTYTGQNNIYFNEAGRLPAFNGEVIRDSTVMSFSLAKNTDSVVNMIIKITGAVSDQDRSYKLVIDPVSTAIPGKHFDALPQTFSIKKNKLQDTVKIKFHRTADLQAQNYTLFFKLVANENFSTEMVDKLINATTGQRLSFIRYRWFLNDIVKKPGRWTDGYLGVFTRKKLSLLAQVLNVEPSYLDTSVSIAEITAYGKFMQRYLNEQKAAGNTIYEEDGSEMIMGSLVQ